MNFIFARLGVPLYGYFKYAAHRLGRGGFLCAGTEGLSEVSRRGSGCGWGSDLEPGPDRATIVAMSKSPHAT